jgi:hypothetical protein
MQNRNVARAIGVTAAIAASLTAALAVAIGTHRRRPASPVTRVPELGIGSVPDRPPLWRSRGGPATGPISLTAVSPVPPENPHAPPTPPYGVPRQTA